MARHDAPHLGGLVVKTPSAMQPIRESDLRRLDTASTSDPKPRSPSSRSGTDHLGSVKTRISALISGLHGFDVSTIERRDDWKADAFATLFNATLADILGQNSQEYGEYSIRSFDTLPPFTGVDYPLAEVRQGYQKGIDTAVRKLNLLLDTLDKKMGATEGVTQTARQAGAGAARSADGKVSLVARRGELKNRDASSAIVGAPSPGNRKAVKAAPEVGLAAEIVIDGQPEESLPKEGTTKASNQGSADIPGNNEKEANQREDLDLALNESLEAMRRAVERARSAKDKNVQDEHEATEIKADEETHPLEPKGFVSAEFSYQEPWAGSLPDEPPDGGGEALVPAGEAIVLGDDELPEPVIEDRQERTPGSPGAEPALEAPADHVEPSAALASLDPLMSTEVAMTDVEENDFLLAPSSAYLEEKSIRDIETALPEMGEQAASDVVPSGPIQEVSWTSGHDPLSHAATEQVTEPVRHEVPAHERLSVERPADERERGNRGINFDVVEGELPATCLERVKEPISISSLDLSDVEALADKFAKKLAGPPEPKVPGAQEERLSGDTVWIPAGLDQSVEAAPSGPAKGLAGAVPEPVINAPEVEQNPFAIKDFEKTQSRPKITGADDLRAQIKAITERIDDLKAFDVSSVKERFDPRARELRDSVNNTIADVFGRNTPAYWHRSLPEFDALPVVLGSPRPPSPEEVRGSYLRAIDKAVTKLTAILESLKQGLERLEPGTKSKNELALASAPGHEKHATVVERQEEVPPGVEPPSPVKEPTKEQGVVIETMGVGQNPFAMRDSEKKQSRPARAVDLRTQVGAIVERINDLKSFDPTTVTQRHDPRARQLCDSVNNTIADVFGRNTPAYWRHSLPSFEAGYTIVGSPSRSPAELKRSYEEGINKAVTKLTAIAESLKSKLGQSESHSSV